MFIALQRQPQVVDQTWVNNSRTTELAAPGQASAGQWSGSGRRISAVNCSPARSTAADPPDEHPLRHVADLPPRRAATLPGRSGPTRCGARLHRTRHRRAVVASARRGRPRARRPSRGDQHRYRVGQVAGLPAADPDGAGDDPRRPGAVSVADQGAGPRPAARRARADRGGARGSRDVAPTAYDGDSPAEVRRFARERSRWMFSNPDMIHLSMLRNHARWAVFLRGLRYIVVDECHYYRGIFGSNVAMVLRRLLRLCARYSATRLAMPTVIFASATTASPGGDRVGADRADRRRGHRGRIAAGRPDGGAVGTGAAATDSPVRTARRCGVRRAPRRPG